MTGRVFLVLVLVCAVALEGQAAPQRGRGRGRGRQLQQTAAFNNVAARGRPLPQPAAFNSGVATPRARPLATTGFGAPQARPLPPQGNQGFVNRHGGPPMDYNFSWRVDDQEYGNYYGHREAANSGRVEGTYYVWLPDARLMRVDYYVDGDSGFVPTITYLDAHGPNWGSLPF